mmetsp:Transcript_13223/g.44195  ORF Transcript_13223/g.44195 Transcript_13223/m.44195 type:complete len:274 (-) Transcript_13223:657-1478(-)
MSQSPSKRGASSSSGCRKSRRLSSADTAAARTAQMRSDADLTRTWHNSASKTAAPTWAAMAGSARVSAFRMRQLWCSAFSTTAGTMSATTPRSSVGTTSASSSKVAKSTSTCSSAKSLPVTSPTTTRCTARRSASTAAAQPSRGATTATRRIIARAAATRTFCSAASAAASSGCTTRRESTAIMSRRPASSTNAVATTASATAAADEIAVTRTSISTSVRSASNATRTCALPTPLRAQCRAKPGMHLASESRTRHDLSTEDASQTSCARSDGF